MGKGEAIRLIYSLLQYYSIDGGLPRAIEIYKYLTGYGTIEITRDAIERYLGI